MTVKRKRYDMSNYQQKTVKEKVTLTGIGLHSGSKVRCTIHPAPANHGIVFIRSDIRGLPRIKADISKVFKTDMCTTIGNEDIYIATVEHLMSALAGMNIDNALIDINASEIPIMDGSAIEFVDAIKEAGTRVLNAPKKIFKLLKPVSLQLGDKWIEAIPAEEFSIKASISFGHRLIGDQIYRFSGTKSFDEEIASARTFGFLKEVEYLHKKGLALGGSLDNAVVLDEEKILNPEGLRFKNEFVRHKVLDAIGDLALLGLQMNAAVEIHKSGHELHTLFLKKILLDPSAYEIVESNGARAQREEEEIASPIAAHAY